MPPFALFVGGVSSGKTRLAEKWALSFSRPCLMLATCHGQDAEMTARIIAHKKARGDAWFCLEEPLEPLGRLRLFRAERPDFQGCVVLDSLGMWITNLMGLNLSPRDILRRCQALARAFASLEIPCAVVSEECGLGFVPLSGVARKFGDILGNANQVMARNAETVIFASCGLPLALKGSLPLPV